MNIFLNFLMAIMLATVFISCDKSLDSELSDHCTGLVTDTAGTNDPARIYMPNAFTPNGDGINDLIRPITINTASIDFKIYDQTNTLVFNSSQAGPAWNTTVTPASFIKYFYTIQVNTSAGHKIGQCGELYKLSCRPVNTIPLYFEDQLTSAGFTGVTAEALSNCP